MIVARMIVTISAPPRLAMDRSLRSYSRDGSLHVARSNISKAMVCPYLGAEIPKSEELGLDPGRVYYLFRDPDELAAAADTFNNLPILSKHVHATAETFPDHLVIGTTGTDSAFYFPYLTNSLAFWKIGAIKEIENKNLEELSSCYHYDVDMTAGNFNGLHYDGIMRNIVGNHVALVKDGRAGPDVVVGDAKLEVKGMAKSNYASMITGALVMALAPKLAQDAQLDISKLTDGIKGKADRDAFLSRLRDQTAGKLAADADLDDVVELLDKLDAIESEDEPAAVDADPDTDNGGSVLEYCRGKMSSDDYDGLAALMGKGMASDEDPDPEDDDDKEDKAVKVTKSAMDAAILDAENRAVKRVEAMHDAKQAVKPLVGVITVAMDSASAVYRFALEKSGVKAPADASESSLRTMTDLAISAKSAAPAPRVAMDAAAVKGFDDRFPAADRLFAS